MGITQLFTGTWSDKIGRIPLIITGMILCAISCTTTLWFMNFSWWVINAILMGFGMAILYPTLSAAVNDYCDQSVRGTVLGVYRFWRDFGYFVSAITLSVVAIITDHLESAFWMTTIVMLGSASLLLFFSIRNKTIVKIGQ